MSNELIVSGVTWGALKEQCSMLVKSGFLPKDVNTPEKALAIALKGRELNIPPMQAFAQINVIQGKPAVSAELQLALIYRNVPGAKIEFERLDNEGCTVIATRPGHKPVRIAFLKADAEAAQLLSKDNWKKYARSMYRSRCISEMARTVFPDAIMGCSYTPEEMGASVNEDGEVIEIGHTPPKIDPPKADEKSSHIPKLYTGSESQYVALTELLIKREVPETRWDHVRHAMKGKPFSFPSLEAILKESSN